MEDRAKSGICPKITEIAHFFFTKEIPKIKYYFSVNTKLNSKGDFNFKNDFLNKKINSLIKQFI